MTPIYIEDMIYLPNDSYPRDVCDPDDRGLLLTVDAARFLDGPRLGGQELVVVTGPLVVILAIADARRQTLADQRLAHVAGRLLLLIYFIYNT